MITAVLSLAGFMIAAYATSVKQHLARNPRYLPFCEVSKKVSCVRALTGKYSELFAIANTVFGLFYYTFVFILSFAGFVWPLVALTFLGLLGSLGLAYISYVKMKNFCVVCSAIYLVNLLLFIVALKSI
ncbi:hypothetical protein HZB01_01755 [Candidatus Woesearchaeota archaeon]|nr:hypothetical protein [Candidatus Woesearchaeota archaeon]